MLEAASEDTSEAGAAAGLASLPATQKLEYWPITQLLTAATNHTPVGASTPGYWMCQSCPAGTLMAGCDGTFSREGAGKKDKDARSSHTEAEEKKNR